MFDIAPSRTKFAEVARLQLITYVGAYFLAYFTDVIPARKQRGWWDRVKSVSPKTLCPGNSKFRDEAISKISSVLESYSSVMSTSSSKITFLIIRTERVRWTNAKKTHGNEIVFGVDRDSVR